MSKCDLNLDLTVKSQKSETFELSLKAKKLISKMLHEEISLNFTKFISPYLINKSYKQYFKEYLQEISKELISRSHKKKGISQYIFAKYFELPGLISRRLFIVFNNNNNEEEFLSADNFINNMLDLFVGGFNQLSNIIFNLFDFKNDGQITSDEISIILSYIPISHKNYDNKKFKFEQDEFIDRIQSQEEIALSLDILFANKKSITYNEFVDIIKNKNSDIFIFLLIFILERKPFSKEIIEIYKEDNCNEESEENEDEKEEEDIDIYIIPPIIGKDKEKISTPKISKRKIVLPVKKNQLKLQNENDEKNKCNTLHHSKSDENLKKIDEKHKEDERTIITYNDHNSISEINFIKVRPSESKLFPIKRKSKRLINIQNDKNQKQKMVYNKTVWHLKNFKLNKNFYLKKIEDDSEEDESSESSSDSDSEEEEEESSENSEKNKNKLSDNENDINIDNCENIIKEGYLYKISDNGKIKKLWFKLINNLFHYQQNILFLFFQILKQNNNKLYHLLLLHMILL